MLNQVGFYQVRPPPRRRTSQRARLLVPVQRSLLPAERGLPVQIAKLLIIPFVCLVERCWLGRVFTKPVILSVLTVVTGVAIVYAALSPPRGLARAPCLTCLTGIRLGDVQRSWSIASSRAHLSQWMSHWHPVKSQVPVVGQGRVSALTHLYVAPGDQDW